VIKGKAEMGVASSASPNAVVTIPYDAATDNENFTVTGEKYYDAEPGTFFIFSPQEMHRPAFKVDGYDTIKKIVIKVRVPK
jgi:YhcH/YjgK/YiaL family protein